MTPCYASTRPNNKHLEKRVSLGKHQSLFVKIYRNSVSSSVLLAPGFLYTNLCLYKIYYAKFCYALLRLEKLRVLNVQWKHRSVYEIKTNSLIEKFICLTILSVNSVYKFPEMYLLIAYMLPQIDIRYFSKIDLVGFQYEPVNLDVNKACFEEQDIHSTREKSRKSQRYWMK